MIDQNMDHNMASEEARFKKDCPQIKTDSRQRNKSLRKTLHVLRSP